jgi:hypothetical protein
MLEWIVRVLPVLGLTGNWRGYRMGGKAVGGANMPTDLKKKFEAARAAGNMDQAKTIADRVQKFNDDKKAAKVKPVAAANNVDIKIAGKEISVPGGTEIVVAMSQPPVGAAYRVMPKGGSDSDFIREKAQGNYVPVLQFKTAQAAQNYADKINKAMAKPQPKAKPVAPKKRSNDDKKAEMVVSDAKMFPQVFNEISPGQKIKVKYNDFSSGDMTKTFVVGRKSKSQKFGSESITFKDPDTGKAYGSPGWSPKLVLKDGRVRLAIGDMAANLLSIERIN